MFLVRVSVLAPRICLFDLPLESLEAVLEVGGGLVEVLQVGDLGGHLGVTVLQ